MNQNQAARIKAAKTRTYIARTMAALPAEDRSPFKAALDGTRDAFEVWALAPEQNRPAVLLAFYLNHCPPDRWREMMRLQWLQAHRALSDAAKAAGVDRVELFRAAQFAIPADLPETLTVFRGTVGIIPRVAATGLSWTTDRAGAAWVACGLLRARGIDPSKTPCVLRRDVRPSEVLFFEPRNDALQRIDEIVLAPGPARVDGTPADWRAFAAEWEEGELARPIVSDEVREAIATARRRLGVAA